MSKNMIHSFGVNTTEHLPRSKIPFPLRKRCEFRQGALIPIVHKLVTPNSLWTCNAKANVRLLLTPARPFMGDMYFTYGFYFVPLRILFKDYVKMFNNGEPVDWQNPPEYVLPSITELYRSSGTTSFPTLSAGYDGVVPGSMSVDSYGRLVGVGSNLTNYLGTPETEQSSGADEGLPVSMAPEAAYLSIWNNFWRDQNYQNSDPDVSKIFNFVPGSSGNRTSLHLCMHYANALHDYMTSLLPDTQKGPKALAFSHLITMPDTYSLQREGSATVYSIKLGDGANDFTAGKLGTNSSGEMAWLSDGSSWDSGTEVQSTNMGVEISVNNLRMAFALQRARERDARTGSRFPEAMLGIFGGHLPNAVADMPEFLGGNTIQLNLTSVPATAKSGGSGNTDVTPGYMGAFSFTRDDSGAFVKQFDEPGILMCVGCVRIKRVYAQGIERDRTKLRRFDSYDPCFAHIPEQPVYGYQMLPHNNASARTVIGFQEAWAEDIKPVDQVSGLMGCPSSGNDMKVWNLLNFRSYGSNISPKLTYPEDQDEIAKACVDYNSSYPSWVFGLDFTADCTVTAPRPVYSKPGLIDHIAVN